jgi:hypothetical protein
MLACIGAGDGAQNDCPAPQTGAGEPVGCANRLQHTRGVHAAAGLSFAAITTQAHHELEVSQGAVGDLAGIFPLLYVILALPAGVA